MKTHPLIELFRYPDDYCYIHKEVPCTCQQIGRMSPAQVDVVMEDWLKEWINKKDEMKTRPEYICKLTLDIIGQIRRRRILGQSQDYIAKAMNLSQTTISRVYNHTNSELLVPTV